MRLMLIGLISVIFVMGLVPLSFAASDCEHTCCYDFNGGWDDDFDQCSGGDAGFSTCVSDCEAANYAYSAQQGPDTSEGTHYTCCCSTAFLLAALGAAAFLHMGRGAVS